jgi:nucleoside 2-deoxyribosyltransferase
MNIYVAASWASREYARNVTNALHSNGIECTNGWMDREGETPDEYRNCALADLNEVCASDGLVLLNDTESTGGGMHFEAGYAFARGKRVFVIGRRTGVFHYLPGVEYFATVSEFIAAFAVKADCGCGKR